MLETDEECVIVDGNSTFKNEDGDEISSIEKSAENHVMTQFIGMPTKDLARYCLPADFSLLNPTIQQSSLHWAPGLNNDGSDRTILKKLEEASLHFQSHITKLNVARSGRDLQRWLIDPKSEERIRLVSGTLPIMQNGNILLVSSRRKQTFVLPKGGWETDETIEQSALRETFEEAGIWGVLGAPFDPVIYRSGRSHQQSTSDQNHESLEKSLEYSKVKLVIYPLFVKEIKDQWPESSRKRKVFTLKEALSALIGRPEFAAAVDSLLKHIEQT